MLFNNRKDDHAIDRSHDYSSVGADSTKPEIPTLTVAATGSATAAPDIAFVTVGMETAGKPLPTRLGSLGRPRREVRGERSYGEGEGLRL